MYTIAGRNVELAMIKEMIVLEKKSSAKNL